MIDMSRADLNVGSVVMYHQPDMDRAVPHLVLRADGDILTLKPVSAIVRDLRGSVVAPRGRCTGVRMVRRVNKPELNLTLRQGRFVLKALDLATESALRGAHEVEMDELAAMHNARGLIEDYMIARKESR